MTTRRQLLKLLATAAATSGLVATDLLAAGNARPRLANGQPLPAIGMGTWITFNVGNDRALRLQRTEVLRAFFDQGGGMIDCSPMYGSAASVTGFGLAQLGQPDALFSAEKVWTWDGDDTRTQIEEQLDAWRQPAFDLVQVHNLLAWEDHLPRLFEMKAAGELRYVGITTSHGRRHDELERILSREPLDFVQLTYNLTHREAEQRLLPLAQERGIAVIANRPYDGGRLIKSLKRSAELPQWAVVELNCQTWADFLLRFIISHPAVTCAIPATTRVDHMRENMAAGTGPLPDRAMRQRMVEHIAAVL